MVKKKKAPGASRKRRKLTMKKRGTRKIPAIRKIKFMNNDDVQGKFVFRRRYIDFEAIFLVYLTLIWF